MGDIVALLATVTNDVDVTGLSGMIANLGFPIFVAVWLLWKSHKDTAIIQDSINKLENAIIELSSYIKSLKGNGNGSV